MKALQRVIWGMIIFTYFSFFLGHGQGICQDLHCIPCHEDVVNQKTIYSHVHEPFSENKCSICHLSSEAPSPDDINHENRLRTRDEIGTDVCYTDTCHPIKTLGVSHPVGVYPSDKIRIPDVLPTGTGGKLLCITCHRQHMGDEKPRGRKPVSFQLCIACHGRDYYE